MNSSKASYRPCLSCSAIRPFKRNNCTVCGYSLTKEDIKKFRSKKK